MKKAAKVSAMLKLSYEELLYIEALLDLFLDQPGAKNSKRGPILLEAKNKISATLNTADKAGMIDRTKIRT